jgi:hypothetical protein
MNDLITANAEMHELLYLLIGVPGTLLTFAVLCLRTYDLANLLGKRDESGKRINGARRALAIERMASCAVWFFICGYMLTAGFNALHAPPREWTFWRYVTVATFYAAGLGSVALAGLQLWIRRKQ